MATIPTPHPSWCDPTECSARPDGQLVHRSAGVPFDLNTTQIWTGSMLTVQLAETGEGIEVGVTVQGAISSYSATLFPEVAAELGDALLDHAERALGLMAGPRGTQPPEADLPVVLLEALEDVSISDEERQALLEVCGLGEDVVRHVAALITRARRNSSADR